MRPDDWRRYEGHVVHERYHLRQLIGSGSFGGVFAADEVVAERSIARVAIKLIEPQSDDYGTEIAELAALRGMNHPHLARGLAVGQCHCLGHDLLFVVMDLADDTLLARLRHSTLSPDETLELAAHVADGLSYLHTNRIVHRDLKPANLLRTGPLWQLADFGLVRTLAADGSALLTRSDPSGTFPYMPPDAFRGEISPAWDLWSLGILLVEAMTGQRPFNDATLAEYVYAILHKEPQIPENLPEPLLSIIRGCLAQDRHTRWTADQVKQAAFAPVAARFGSGGLPSYSAIVRGSGGTPPPVLNIPSPRSKESAAPAAGSGESPTRLSSSPQPQEPEPPIVTPAPTPLPPPPPAPIPGPPSPLPPQRRTGSPAGVIAGVAAAALLIPATLFAVSRSRNNHPTPTHPTPHASRREATPKARPTPAPRKTTVAVKTPTPRPTPDAAAVERRRRAQIAAAKQEQARQAATRQRRQEQQETEARAQARRDTAAQARREQRRRERQETAANQPKAPKTRFCPICGERLAPGQHFCSKTGQRI